MNHWKKRLLALALALALLLPAATGRAVLSDVYFTAVNEKLLELDADTMPFWSGGVLYVASRVFDGTDLGVNYARSGTLAMLYTSRTDLRFDLEEQLAYDRDGKPYTGHAIERGGNVFFPLDMVCDYFGLSWTFTRMDDVPPLIRVTSSSAVLSVDAFIDAIAWRTERLYADYEKSVLAEEEPVLPPETRPSRPANEPNTNPPNTADDPPIQAAEGQKVYLILDSPEDARQAMEALDGVQATFLLSVKQMADADLLRGLVAEGHAVALRASGASVEDVAAELAEARALLWQAACLWLELVWYNGGAEIGPLLEEEGCVRVHSGLDRRSQGLRNASAADTLLRRIGSYREDVAVLLNGSSLGGLSALLESLDEAGFQLCPWRLTA